MFGSEFSSNFLGLPPLFFDVLAGSGDCTVGFVFFIFVYFKAVFFREATTVSALLARQRPVDVQETVIFTPGVVTHLHKQLFRDVLTATLIDALLVNVVLGPHPELGEVTFADMAETTRPLLYGAECRAIQMPPVNQNVDQVRLPALG